MLITGKDEDQGPFAFIESDVPTARALGVLRLRSIFRKDGVYSSNTSNYRKGLELFQKTTTGWIMQPLKVFLAGGKGFGKTTYLAALFGKYALPDQNTKFFCTLPPMAENKLSEILHDMTKSEWADATQVSQIDEYLFKFQVRSPKNGRDYTAATTLFYDYPGGVWSGEDASADTGEQIDRINSIAAQADAIVLVTCGDLLNQSIQNDKLDRNLSRVLLRQLRTIGARSDLSKKPIYIVISKWDQFSDDDASVQKVRSMLLTNPFVEDFFANCRAERTQVRLVPVSSVGAGFARRDNSGVMHINSGASLRQLNVEVPLSAILRDRMKFEFDAWQAETKSRADSIRNRHPGDVEWWKAPLFTVATVLGNSKLLDDIRRNLDWPRYSMDAFLGMMKHPYESQASEIEDTKQRNHKQASAMYADIGDAEEATNYGVQVLLAAFNEYQTKYPSADFSA